MGALAAYEAVARLKQRGGSSRAADGLLPARRRKDGDI
jgi:hypothetical protein|tara:strand:+ start:26263 stop:26376 length:114 start_codon:yes stop_codon:yes gene_type:complete